MSKELKVLIPGAEFEEDILIYISCTKTENQDLKQALIDYYVKGYKYTLACSANGIKTNRFHKADKQIRRFAEAFQAINDNKLKRKSK